VLKPFRSAGYRWLWLSNASGSAGRWALVLVLSSQMLIETRSSFWVGLALFLTQAPVVVMAPVSGVLADRFDRRLLNVLSSALATIVTGMFAVLTWVGLLSLPAMLALSFIYGISFVFQLTLRSTLVPGLVRPEDLVSGVSWFQVGTQGAQFVGPAIAAPLLVSGGPAAAWLFCAVLYVASTILSVPVGAVRARPTSAQLPNGVAASLTYLRLRPLAWTAILAVSVHCALTMGYQGMLPAFVSVDLHSSEATFGALLVSIGLGAVTGSVLLAQLAAPRLRSTLFAISLAGSGISLAVMGAAGSVPLAVISGFFVGSTQAMFMSMALALIQGSVEDDFRGRATSVYQMITGAPMAVFGWGMGGLADITEPRPLMIASGVAFVVLMGLWVVRSQWLRTLFRADVWTYREVALTPGAVS
jgi:MFS family permease